MIIAVSFFTLLLLLMCGVCGVFWLGVRVRVSARTEAYVRVPGVGWGDHHTPSLTAGLTIVL